MKKESVRDPTALMQYEIVRDGAFDQFQLVLGDTSVKAPEKFISTAKFRKEVPFVGVQLSFFN